MDLRDLIEQEIEQYLEWPTADKSHVTTVSAKLFAEHMARLYAGHIADARKKIGRPQIREVFLRNGAAIPADHDDLPDWVYESVFELLDSVIQQAGPAIQYVAPAVQGEPVAVVDADDDDMWADILPDVTVKVGQTLYAAPQPAEQQPAPDVTAVVEALEAIQKAATHESIHTGIQAGTALGCIAAICDVALAAHRKQGGEV